MAVTAALVKELREVSGAGMVDCKNALVEADGNLEKAVEILREKGLAAAAKKAGRIASEGLVYTHITDDGKIGVIVEVNSETDFVAKNQEFQSYVHNVALQVVKSGSKDIETFLTEKWHENEGVTVAEALSQKIAVIGENLSIRRFEKFAAKDNETLVSYVHGGGRVAVLINLASGTKGDAIVTAGKDVCMQIAAMNPKFVSRNDVPADFIAKEKEILTGQAQNDENLNKKPPQVVEKIIEGRLDKGLKEICLLEQEYVKEGDMTVAAYLKSVAADLNISAFVRFETGEGIEKKNEDFAEEVSKAMGK
ncbi:MAG: translation elongation factor Ts [Defluviitaleaceae bacterium]|nr:translation elongation factor Ts [Defluviitaleaceae bacterium]